MMKLKFLGTRGEEEKFTSTHKKHSGILIDDVLFDVGEQEYLELKPRAIFVTHLHPDHAFWAREKTPKIDLPQIFHPGNLKLLEQVKIHDMTVTPFPVTHSKKVRSVAYLIEEGKLRILYTGDMIWIRKKYHEKLKNLDLVITDGSFFRKGGMIRRDKETGEVYGHQGISNLVEFFKKLEAKKVIFTHFGTWMINDPEKGKEEIRKLSNDIKVDAAIDNEEITLEEKSELGVTTTEEIEPMIPKVIAKIQPKVGLYLVKPHAEMIMSGEKTLIIKSKKFTAHMNEPVYLLQGKFCYGTITLKEPVEINSEEFDKLRDKHKITDEEAFKHWGWKKDKPLYKYEFNIDQRFDPPLPVKLPQGIQVFVNANNIKFLEVKNLTLLDLFDYRDETLSEELYAEIIEELFNRNVFKSQVFELIRGWISDYKVGQPNDRQLGDDYRIVLGWYSSIKKGKKLFKRMGEEKKEITLDDCKQLGLKIFREMIRRDFTFNQPETYKPHARELYEWLISQVGKDKVPFKDVEKQATTTPEPAKVERPDLENIDDVYVKGLTDSQLIALHARLHKLFKEIGKITEPLQNAHIFIWKEMKHRKLEHNIDDKLDRATSLEVVEYPAPEEGVPQQITEDMAKQIQLDQVLKALPDTIMIDDPVHVYLCGRVVNEGQIPLSHDLDILFKQGWYHAPTVNTFLDEISKNDPEVAKRLHFVWDSLGPHIGFTVPLYRLAFVKVSASEMRRTSPFEFLAGAAPQVMRPFIGMKPKSGFEKNEFWDLKEMWEKWAKNYIDKGIVIQKKFDGMRFQIHCKGQQIKMITEDRQRDRAAVFKKSIAEILKHKKVDSFIVDAEMVEYACGAKQTNRPDLCEQLPREEMIKWIGAVKKELDDENVVFHIHDCTFVDGQAINEKGYVDRWNAISKIFGELKHWKKVEGTETHDMKGFFSLARKYRSMTNSEGIVAKASDSIYPIKYSGENRTSEWAKLKNLKEIDVMVWKVVQKKTAADKPLNQWLYESVFSIPCVDEDKYREKDVIKIQGKCYLYIGRSYATGEKVSPGTIIIVRPIRVAEFKDPKGKLYYTWMFPYYDGKHAVKTQPDSIDVVKKLVAIGTGPGKEKLSALVFDLPSCPFWEDEKVCPLKERFRLPRDELSTMKVEYLKFPIVCKFANHYKCRFVKSYYYSYKTIRISDGKVTDEDDLRIEGEED